MKIPNTVLSQELAGETVLLNLDTGTYFGLDPVGTQIWQLLKEGRSIQAIYETMLEQYEVDAERLVSDLHRFVRALHKQGLIERA